jgi:hypothetical protein
LEAQQRSWLHESEQSGSADAVTRSIEIANELLDELVPGPGTVAGLIEVLEAFHPRELVRFDEQAWAPFSGIQWRQVPRLRAPLSKAATERASTSGSGIKPTRAEPTTPAPTERPCSPKISAQR